MNTRALLAVALSAATLAAAAPVTVSAQPAPGYHQQYRRVYYYDRYHHRRYRCERYRERRAANGTVIGAVTGGILGAAIGGHAGGVLLGAGAGALAGHAIASNNVHC